MRVLPVNLVIVQNSPTRQLAASAANSYQRMLASGLPGGGINSAYRSTASQRAIFLSRYEHRSVTAEHPNGPFGDVKWYDSDGNGKAERYVRVRGLPVAVPGTSKHNQGLAMDISTGTERFKWLLNHGSRFGWHRPLPGVDPVHWEYVAANDADLREQTAARTKMRKIQGFLKVKETGVRNASTIQAWSLTERNARKNKYWYVRRLKKIQAVLGVSATGKPNSETDKAWDDLARKAK